MTLKPFVLETCRGVKPSGCPHALPLPADFGPALALAGRCLGAYTDGMRPGLRFADILFPGGLPGLPAWAAS